MYASNRSQLANHPELYTDHFQQHHAVGPHDYCYRDMPNANGQEDYHQQPPSYEQPYLRDIVGDNKVHYRSILIEDEKAVQRMDYVSNGQDGSYGGVEIAQIDLHSSFMSHADACDLALQYSKLVTPFVHRHCNHTSISSMLSGPQDRNRLLSQ
jgi:hypothetical protein